MNDESALSGFRLVLQDVKELWAWAAAAAAVPFLANLLSLAPPWPSALVYLTAIFELLLLVWAYHNLKGKPKRTISKVINFGIPILLIILIAYLFLSSLFFFEIVGSSKVGLRGYECTKLMLENYDNACPFLRPDVIRDAEWDANNIWTQNSIAVVRVMFVTLWLSFFIVLTSILGAFVVRQHDLAARRSRERAS